MPPRGAVLVWPNGETSAGALSYDGGPTMTFHPTSADGPLARRVAAEGREDNPAPLPVVPAGPGDAPVLRPALLGAVAGVHPDMLEDLADAAGGSDEGATHYELSTLAMVMSGVLRHIEAQASDPVAVRLAREAMEAPVVLLRLSHEGDAYLCEPPETLDGGQTYWPPDLGRSIENLEPGGHFCLRVRQDGHRIPHAMGISATRLPGDQVRLSVINSNGWQEATGNADMHRAPAVSKTVPMHEAAQALRELGGSVLPRPADLPRHARAKWPIPSAGLPLLLWLKNAVAPEERLRPTDQRMTPQKGEDCAIECEFAWLASMLPRSDYKLAKAHVLSVLTEAGRATDRSDRVLERLRERVTSSLSGYAMSVDA